MASLAFMPTGKLIGMLQSIDPTGAMAVCILANDRLGIGAQPGHPTMMVDFAGETAIPYTVGETQTSSRTEPAVLSRSEVGESGRYWIQISGRRFAARSLKDLLRSGLLALEKVSPGTLEKLSHIKPRSKRIVARDRTLLFETSYLAGTYSEQLCDGWWFGTNNSAQETNSWLERAALCAALTWGRDCKTSL